MYQGCDEFSSIEWQSDLEPNNDGWEMSVDEGEVDLVLITEEIIPTFSPSSPNWFYEDESE